MSSPTGHVKRYEIRFYETDHESRLTPVTLFNFLQEAATSHSKASGLSLERLAGEGIAWFLTRIHVRMDRYPRRGQGDVLVRTWPFRLKGLYAVREFEIAVHIVR